MAREQSPPPAGLDRASRALWRAARDEAMAQSTWRPVDVTLLERYVRSAQQAREARERLEGSGWTSEGSQGQLVQHPDAKTLREAEADSHDYAGALLLTPAARSRHNITVTPTGGGRLAAVLALDRGRPGAA